MVHELESEDALYESREVLYICSGGGELATSGDVVGHPSLKHDRLELGSSGIDRRHTGSGVAVDDVEAGVEGLGLDNIGVIHDGGGE